MLKERARLVAGSLRAVDMAMLGVAFPIAYYLRDEYLTGQGHLYPITSYWPLFAATLLVWQLSARLAGVYGRYRTSGILVEIRRLLRAFVVLALIVAAAQFAWKRPDRELSRLFFGLYYVIAFLLLAGNRLGLRLLAHAARRRGFNTRALAVVGTSDMAKAVIEAIAAHPEWGYVFAGYVLENGDGAPPGARVLGRLDDLGQILEREVLDEVVIGARQARLERIEAAVRLCEEQGVGVKVLLDLFPNGSSHVAVEELEGMPVLSFTTAPTDIGALSAKRVFDLVVSVLFLVLLAPLFLGIAIAIKLDSPGPVFFRQRRVGLNGRQFWMWKFRSMCDGAEAMRPELASLNEMGGPTFKVSQDPRITRVGRWLRRTSLDEFPQFWNVVKGDMSVVGPRPPIPSEVKEYQRWQRRRLSVRPGLTCTWQVSGRNELDFDRWMELDLHYIDHWSLWHDVSIVLRTIPAVLLGRGAR
jgi:exopolysaccharide biosynthesis polyprenyl glycosylphosphotransferase